MSQLNNTELLRYARQILLDDWDIEAQLALKQSSVLLIGAGGLGCPIAQTLVRAGLGFLAVVDDDVVEISNLQRQSLFFDTDIGYSKALTLTQALKQHNPHANLRPYNTRFEAITGDTIIQEVRPDLLIDGSDNFATRDLVNRLAVRHQIPLLSTSVIAQTGQLALFEPQTGCYHCIFDDSAGNDERTCANTGVLASTTAVVGTLGAQIALRFLGQANNPIKNKLLIWQGATMTLKHLQFSKNTQCPICQSHS